MDGKNISCRFFTTHQKLPEMYASSLEKKLFAFSNY